jgi:hypothetical protein
MLVLVTVSLGGVEASWHANAMQLQSVRSHPMNVSLDTVMFVATWASVGDAVILWTLVLGIFSLFWFLFLKCLYNVVIFHFLCYASLLLTYCVMLLGGMNLSVHVHHNPSFQKNIFLFAKKPEFNIHMLRAFAFPTFQLVP